MRAAANATTADITREREGKRVTLAGRVESVRKIFTRKRQYMAEVKLEDERGQMGVIVFPKLYGQCAGLLEDGAFLVVKGRVEQDSRDEALRVLAEAVTPLDDAADASPTVGDTTANALPPGAAPVNGDGPPSVRDGELPAWLRDDRVAETDSAGTGVDTPAAKVTAPAVDEAVSADPVAPAEQAGPPQDSEPRVPAGAAAATDGPAGSDTQIDAGSPAAGAVAAQTGAADAPAEDFAPVADAVPSGPAVELVLQRTQDESEDLGRLQRLANVLSRNPGDTRVALRIILNGVHVRIDTHDLIALTPEVEDEIEDLLGTAPLRKAAT